MLDKTLDFVSKFTISEKTIKASSVFSFVVVTTFSLQLIKNSFFPLAVKGVILKAVGLLFSRNVFNITESFLTPEFALMANKFLLYISAETFSALAKAEVVAPPFLIFFF